MFVLLKTTYQQEPEKQKEFQWIQARAKLAEKLERRRVRERARRENETAEEKELHLKKQREKVMQA